MRWWSWYAERGQSTSRLLGTSDIIEGLDSCELQYLPQLAERLAAWQQPMGTASMLKLKRDFPGSLSFRYARGRPFVQWQPKTVSTNILPDINAFHGLRVESELSCGVHTCSGPDTSCAP